MSARIAGFGSTVPPAVSQEALWDGFFAAHFGEDRRARAAWRGSGVRTRHAVADPRHEDLRGWGTRARMERFLAEALPLAKGAAGAALARAGVAAEEVGYLSVVTCTGYATPGLDTFLARDLGMDESVQRLHVGHMGCFAAVPGLAALSDAAVARGSTGLMVCVELPSLHVQPPTEEIDQIVAHALFADAAAALVVRPGGAGLEVVDIESSSDSTLADLMTWEVTDHGFRMRLSPDVPRALEARVEAVTSRLLGRNGLALADVGAWAVHPGGPRILDVVSRRLGLPRTALDTSREVLRDNGNCSSATLPLILERLVEEGVEPGAPVLAMAFGPGLTLAAALLRNVA